MSSEIAESNSASRWIRGAWAVFRKDVRLEVRDRYGVSMLLMFMLSALLLGRFAMGNEPLSESALSGLLWIIIVFAASIGLGRAFISEEERGTILLLRMHVAAAEVFTGKLLYNFVLLLFVNLVMVGAFVFLLNVDVHVVTLLIATLALGSLGLAGASTLLAAIVARSANRAPMLPVLVFPILIPLLLSVVNATGLSLSETGSFTDAAEPLWTLFGFSGVVITASILLFDYIWHD